MNLQTPLLSCLIRCFPALSLIFFLLLHHILYPDFINFRLSILGYSLSFFVLFIESLFLFIYKDKTYPKSVELGLLFLSAFFLASLLIVIKVPTALFFIFIFLAVQTLSLVFVEKLFQTTVLFVYCSLLFPLFLMADYQSLDQYHALVPFTLLNLALFFTYLFCFYFILKSFNTKNSKHTITADGNYRFFLNTSLDALRKLKPFVKQVSKKFLQLEEELNQKVNILENQPEKIHKDLKSLEQFTLNYIEYLELFSEKLDPKKVSLETLLNSCLSQLEDHPRKPEQFNLNQCLKSKKQFKIQASEKHLKKAFTNIILNAFEACRFTNKQAEFDIYYSAPRGGKWLVIHFIDTGQGIEPEEERKLFSPFFTKKFGLAGLGLSYAKKVIELHQGDIQIKREEEKTKVIVRLPLIEFEKPDHLLKKTARFLKTA